MAVYVLVRFDNDEDAKQFAISNNVAELPDRSIAAAYKCPTLFCDGGSHKLKQRGFGKGEKWGWWLCSECGRPTKLASENMLEDSSFGYNVLESYLRALSSIET